MKFKIFFCIIFLCLYQTQATAQNQSNLLQSFGGMKPECFPFVIEQLLTRQVQEHIQNNKIPQLSPKDALVYNLVCVQVPEGSPSPQSYTFHFSVDIYRIVNIPEGRVLAQLTTEGRTVHYANYSPGKTRGKLEKVIESALTMVTTNYANKNWVFYK